MIIGMLLLIGLCLGSFVNALVWRIHEQSIETAKKTPNKPYLAQLSLTKGRSLCPHCKHQLAAQDLIPVVSWLSLRGKCRYCHKRIAVQYPLVEATTAALFVTSYIWWPVPLTGAQVVMFGLWLLLVVGFMALVVYDLHWLLLPNRILYPLGFVAGLLACVQAATAARPLIAVVNTALAVVVGGGLFYLLFQLSNGKWIGGGDVKLGWLLGLVVATPARSLLVIFLASIGGSLVAVPLLVNKRLKRTSMVPFGPFLIAGAIIVQLFGASLLQWYRRAFLGF